MIGQKECNLRQQLVETEQSPFVQLLCEYMSSEIRIFLLFRNKDIISGISVIHDLFRGRPIRFYNLLEVLRQKETENFSSCFCFKYGKLSSLGAACLIFFTYLLLDIYSRHASTVESTLKFPRQKDCFQDKHVTPANPGRHG